MPHDSDLDEPTRSYPIRLSRHATDQIEFEHRRLQESAGTAIADTWENGLMSALGSLATYPKRCAMAIESSHFADGELRQLLFRRSSGSATYRILFSLHALNPSDPTIIWIHAVRHSAQPPMTSLEFQDTLDL